MQLVVTDRDWYITNATRCNKNAIKVWAYLEKQPKYYMGYTYKSSKDSNDDDNTNNSHAHSNKCHCFLLHAAFLPCNMNQNHQRYLLLYSINYSSDVIGVHKQLHHNREFSCWHNINPILHVIILGTAMLVSFPHSLVLENTTKCPRSFHSIHTIIPNYNWVIRIHSIHSNVI